VGAGTCLPCVWVLQIEKCLVPRESVHGLNQIPLLRASWRSLLLLKLWCCLRVLRILLEGFEMVQVQVGQPCLLYWEVTLSELGL